MKKFELTDETIEFEGRTLYRIRALRAGRRFARHKNNRFADEYHHVIKIVRSRLGGDV